MADDTSQKHTAFNPHIPAEARDHMKSARHEMRKSWEALLPPGFVEHRRAARREMLLAARSLVEAALDHMESGEEAKSE